jgi:hypothetical protein
VCTSDCCTRCRSESVCPGSPGIPAPCRNARVPVFRNAMEHSTTNMCTTKQARARARSPCLAALPYSHSTSSSPRQFPPRSAPPVPSAPRSPANHARAHAITQGLTHARTRTHARTHTHAHTRKHTRRRRHTEKDTHHFGTPARSISLKPAAMFA